MEADEALRARAEATREMVEHLVRTGGDVATPDAPLSKLRRLVLRGLRP